MFLSFMYFVLHYHNFTMVIRVRPCRTDSCLPWNQSRDSFLLSCVFLSYPPSVCSHPHIDLILCSIFGFPSPSFESVICRTSPSLRHNYHIFPALANIILCSIISLSHSSSAAPLPAPPLAQSPLMFTLLPSSFTVSYCNLPLSCALGITVSLASSASCSSISLSNVLACHPT